IDDDRVEGERHALHGIRYEREAPGSNPGKAPRNVAPIGPHRCDDEGLVAAERLAALVDGRAIVERRIAIVGEPGPSVFAPPLVELPASALEPPAKGDGRKTRRGWAARARPHQLPGQLEPRRIAGGEPRADRIRLALGTTERHFVTNGHAADR